VLVVDDEPRYRVYLRARLAHEGYEVAVAESGREAIDRGVLFQPEILVADWMLRSIDPHLSTVLITGFASNGLRAAASNARVSDFLEKPFELDDLVTAVARARVDRRRIKTSVPFGVLAVDRSGVILRSSRRLRRMLRHTRAGPEARRVDEVLTPGTLDRLCRPGHGWVHAAALSDRRVRWWARSRSAGAGGIIVLLPERKKYLRHDPSVRMLLGLPRPASAGPLPAGGILLVGSIEEGESNLTQLERTGCSCLLGETPELALRLLATNPFLKTVLVDVEAPGLDLEAFVSGLRGLRPDVRTVGTSAALRDEMRFARLGISRFLQKPWRVGDLIEALEE
jgi:CheY-like chemotaxis protein